MAGTMSQADLVADLKASIQDSAAFFAGASDADFKRQLAAAALDFGRKRRRTIVGALSLVADQALYAQPGDFLSFKSSLWGIEPRPAPKPWESNYGGRLPDVRAVEADGVWKLRLDPAPTAGQISALGADFRYYYFAGHAIGTDATGTSIFAGERGLLMLRGQAEAMRELTFRGVAKPVQLRDGFSNTPRNGHPSFVYEQLMAEFEAASL